MYIRIDPCWGKASVNVLINNGRFFTGLTKIVLLPAFSVDKYGTNLMCRFFAVMYSQMSSDSDTGIDFSYGYSTNIHVFYFTFLLDSVCVFFSIKKVSLR